MSRFSSHLSQPHHTNRTYLLLPANPFWIYGSLLVSWLLNISPIADPLWAPDFLALSIVFWGVREPQFVGLTVAFVLGLLMDVNEGTVLGQHALAYSILSYGAIVLQKRLPWFPMLGQIAHVFPLFVFMQCVVLLVRLWLGGVFPGWEWFSESLVNAILWPVWSLILLLPQKRSPHKDDTRPI